MKLNIDYHLRSNLYITHRLLPVVVFWFCFFWLRWVFVAASRLFSSCGERELLFVAVRGLLIAVASLVAEHGL